MTQNDVHDVTNVSLKTIGLAEHGVYDMPVESLVTLYAFKTQHSIQSIHDNYNAFRKQHRLAYKETIPSKAWKFYIPFEEVAKHKTQLHTMLSPLQDFRVNSLRQPKYAFCTSFLINPGLLERTEKGNEFQVVPGPIIHALKECGAPRSFTDELNVRTKIFYGFIKK
jgi:hypothetical protein